MRIYPEESDQEDKGVLKLEIPFKQRTLEVYPGDETKQREEVFKHPIAEGLL